MVDDLFSDAQLGEDILGNAVTEAVEYDATITAGDGLKITGVNTDGQAVVVGVTNGVKARFVAMYSGVDGDIKEAIKKGLTKVTFGGAVTLPAPVKGATTGKFVAAVTTVTIPSGMVAVTSTGAQPAMTVEAGIACGFAYQTADEEGDTGIIFFNGEDP